VFIAVAGGISLLISWYRPYEKLQQLRTKSDFLLLIEELEGEAIIYSYSVGELSLNGRPITDREFAILASHPGAMEVYKLDLQGTWITDESMKHVEKFSNLRALSIKNCYASDAGLKCLHGHPTLRAVTAVGTQATEQGADALRRTHPAYIVTISYPTTTNTKGATDEGEADPAVDHLATSD
jgi:hypothetical protein